MSNVAIRVENLGKRYRLGQREPYKTLRDVVTDAFTAPFRRWRKQNSSISQSAFGDPKSDYIWALKDVSFEIKQGEVVGVIGRNGAGKSTLLKILSRTTEPAEGYAEIYGRIGSLLEVGTGFHPELTGRENIYLNAAILGMKRREIDCKFGEIAAFSEIEKFLDTPVKRYSSGMYVRLAFAVAAHLEPEILLVDEVLAVGDAAFQKKCLGKMGEASKGGRTILFVSHNMQAIRMLCSRSILLDKGDVISDGPTEKTLSLYNQRLRQLNIDADTDINNPLNRRGGGAIRFTSINIQDRDGNKQFNYKMGDNIRVKMSYKVFEEMRGLAIYVALRSGITREIVTSVRHLLTTEGVKAGTEGTVMVELPEVYIRPGEYPLYLHISEAFPTKVKFDVLDDLTAPLVITASNRQQFSNFDPYQPIGYFSIPSRILMNEL